MSVRDNTEELSQLSPDGVSAQQHGFKRKRDSIDTPSDFKPISKALHPPLDVQQQVLDYVEVLTTYVARLSLPNFVSSSS